MAEMTQKSTMPQSVIENLSKLTEKERKYFAVMWAKYGVLNITSKPGVAKSAIGKSIADKMNFRYMDIRLSMVDETDVGLYPSINEIEVDGKMVKCLDFVVPRWAVEANKQPTIIHFEELNRASQQVRNAALQILLERQIGTDFKFNDSVLMMSSGNLGDEDGTDVEEFDSALNNRLVHINHTLSVDEWIKDFAMDNCHKLITSFIKAHP
jgi:MoxR-like ATPase